MAISLAARATGARRSSSTSRSAIGCAAPISRAGWVASPGSAAIRKRPSRTSTPRSRSSKASRPAASWPWPIARSRSSICLTSRAEESILWGERALQLAEACCDIAVKTHALNNIGVSLVERGEAQQRRRLPGAQPGSWPSRATRPSTRCAIPQPLRLLPGLGQFRRAAKLLEEAVARAQQVHFDMYTISLQSLLGYVEIELEALGRGERAVRTAAPTGAPHRRIETTMSRGRPSCCCGRASPTKRACCWSACYPAPTTPLSTCAAAPCGDADALLALARAELTTPPVIGQHLPAGFVAARARGAACRAERVPGVRGRERQPRVGSRPSRGEPTSRRVARTCSSSAAGACA